MRDRGDLRHHHLSSHSQSELDEYAVKIRLTRDIPIFHKHGLVTGVIAECICIYPDGSCWVRFGESQYLLYDQEYEEVENDDTSDE